MKVNPGISSSVLYVNYQIFSKAIMYKYKITIFFYCSYPYFLGLNQ